MSLYHSVQMSQNATTMNTTSKRINGMISSPTQRPKGPNQRIRMELNITSQIMHLHKCYKVVILKLLQLLVFVGKFSLQTHALCDKHERSTLEADSEALLGMNIAYFPWCLEPCIVAQIFCSKLHAARYSVESHRL